LPREPGGGGWRAGLGAGREQRPPGHRLRRRGRGGRTVRGRGRGHGGRGHGEWRGHCLTDKTGWQAVAGDAHALDPGWSRSVPRILTNGANPHLAGIFRLEPPLPPPPHPNSRGSGSVPLRSRGSPQGRPPAIDKMRLRIGPGLRRPAGQDLLHSVGSNGVRSILVIHPWLSRLGFGTGRFATTRNYLIYDVTILSRIK
jgi:hypothetical protein